MNERTTASQSNQHDTADILDLIRNCRNELIRDFLEEQNLINFLSEHYNLMEVSGSEIERVENNLKDLLSAPVNETLYQPIIEDYSTTGSALFSEAYVPLFYKEIVDLLDKTLKN